MVATTQAPTRSQAMTVVMVGLSFMVMTLDTTVVNVALGAIGEDFSATLSALQWIVNGYTLAFAALLLSAGSLSDRLGRRGVFLAGMVVFTCASLSCALASSEGILIASRIIQGVGASMVMGTGLALLSGAYEGKDIKKRQTAIGMVTAFGGITSALGPLVGGALVDGPGWRYIFVINVPLGIIIVVGTLMWTRPQPKTPGSRIDLTGAVIAVVMLFALNYGLLTGASETWTQKNVIVSLVVAPVLFIVFLVLQHRLGHSATLDLSLFRIPTFSGAIILSFASRVASFGLLPFLILWLTGLLHHTPLQAGLIMLAVSVPMLVVAPLSGKLTFVAPVRVLTCLGMLLIGIGLIWSGIKVDASSNWTSILPGLILIGVGSGVVMPHMMGLAIGVVPAERAGMASGVSNAFFPLGTTVGVAIYGIVMTAAVSSRISNPDAVQAVSAARIDELASSLPPGHEDVVQIARESYMAGVSHILLVAGALSVIFGIVTMFLIRNKDVRGAEVHDARN